MWTNVQEKQDCGRSLNLVYANADVLRNIWFLDESHAYLNSYLNRQTTRFLGYERPDFIAEKSHHSTRVAIMCSISKHDIIDTYFVNGI